MKRMIPISTLLPLLAFLLSACGSLQREAPQIDTYLLAIPLDATAQTEQDARTFAIRRFDSGPAASGRELLYRLGENHYQRSFSQRFLVEPSENLQAGLLRWLDAQPGWEFRPANQPPAASISLSALVHELHVDDSAASPAAVIAITFFVAGAEGGPHSFYYRRSNPLPGSSGQEAMAGFSDGYRQILGELLEELNGLEER